MPGLRGKTGKRAGRADLMQPLGQVARFIVPSCATRRRQRHETIDQRVDGLGWRFRRGRL
jgi:hypothetical protein